MKGVFIIKPDMIDDKLALNYYKEYVVNNNNISFDSFYLIENWVELSKILYEPLDLNTLEELKERRKKILTTIMGYYHFYRNKPAIVSLINIDDKMKLQELYDFKKELRKLFVYNKEKYYLRFDKEVDCSEKLSDINCSLISANYLKLDYLLPSNNEYNLILFNKLHFSDPKEECIERDLNVLHDVGVIKKKNLIKNYL